ncbi:MAG: AraC family transcriptional regulator [Chthoniobacterales bacterium]
MDWISLLSTLKIIDAPKPAIYRCEVAWRWKSPRFTDYDFWLVLDGHGEIIHNGRSSKVSRGTLINFTPGESVEAWRYPENPLHVFALHYTLDLPVKRAREIFPSRILAHDVNKMEETVIDLVAAFEARSDEGDALAHILLKRLLLQMVVDSQTEVLNPLDLRIKEMCRKIGSEPGFDWVPAKLAKAAGLSMSQFNRRFRALVGKPPARYIIERRIDRAKVLLTETEMSLKEIAEALNYADIYYFHRQFHEEAGHTPTSFRAVGGLPVLKRG